MEPDTACALVPDVLQPGLKVVFCGTALGRESFRQKAYYAHPGNRFWRTLEATGLTPHRIAPKDYAQVTRYGIGLTDVCKRAYGNDCDLRQEDFDPAATREKILACAPAYLAFTSKKAASVFLDMPTGRLAYGLQAEPFGRTRLFILTSPSGSGATYWNEDVWHALAVLVRKEEKVPSHA